MSTIVAQNTYFWKGIPFNSLKHSVYISPSTLQVTRILSLLFNLFCSGWTIYNQLQITDQPFYQMFAYLTNWGVFLCTLYFITVMAFQGVSDSSSLWKFPYVVGELAASYQFLIIPFFWIVLAPPVISSMDLLSWVNNLCIHFGCGVTIWVDVIFNHMKFPHSHRIILIIVSAIYAVNNFCWTVLNGTPPYGIIDWKSTTSYVLSVVAFALALIGYEVGRCQYKRKQKLIEKTALLKIDV